MILVYKKDKLVLTRESNNDVLITKEVKDNLTTIKIKALNDIELLDSSIDLKYKFNKKCNMFFNGYQSWTDSYEKTKNEFEPNIKFPFIRRSIVKKYGLNMYGDSTFYDYSFNKLHGYDVFYSKGSTSMFLYNLNYRNAYLIIELYKKKYLRIKSDINGKVLKSGEEFTLFSYKLFDNFYLGLESFNEEFKSNNQKIFGYTSWYNHYQNINEKEMLECLDALDNRFNLFQIDDGYEEYVGDWLNVDKKKFPNGLEPIVKKIHDKGLKAGIWVAPFAAETKSKLYKEHKDWFTINKKGDNYICGVNWDGFYSLDLTNDDAREYVKKCLTHYMDMGFDFFKLDFVYCASTVIPYGKTRAEWQYETYKFLREILKDKLILGCGANLFSAYQNFDYLRVGPDVSLDFDDKAFMRLLHRERNSTKNTIQNTIYRSFMDHHLFLNDSDVFLLRDDNINLSFEQRKALITINSLFSSVLMTSDNISNYDELKNNLLNDSLNLFLKAQNIKFVKNGDFINISYTLKDYDFKLKYDIKRGVFDERQD